MITPDTTRRRQGEPTPDLTDYLIVHRAMTTDLRRIADTVATEGPGISGPRAAALRDYLAGISAEIVSHHRVEDHAVWPFLAAVVDEPTNLGGLTADHEALHPLLDTAQELAARLPVDASVAGQLGRTLQALSAVLDEHVADEERHVFPMIRRYVRVADYQRLQAKFRGNLSLAALRFVVPWVVSHATPEERGRLLAEAGLPMRLVLRLFERGFHRQRALVFGCARISP